MFLFQVQELGLQSSYYHDQGTYQLLRKFMALPFLPADAIPEAFCKLKRKADTDQLKDFATYVEQNWIVSNTWPPSCWSVYLRAIRTNNDVGGERGVIRFTVTGVKLVSRYFKASSVRTMVSSATYMYTKSDCDIPALNYDVLSSFFEPPITKIGLKTEEVRLKT